MPATSNVTEGVSALRLNPKYKYVALSFAIFAWLAVLTHCVRGRPTMTRMKQIISEVLLEKLDKVTYQSDRASTLTKEIADAIKFQLKG